MQKEIHTATDDHSPARRKAILGVITAVAAVVTCPHMTLAASEEEISHSEEAIHQKPVFKASRKRIYDALTETEQFAKLTGFAPGMPGNPALGTKKTEISREVGGTFVLFGGHIIGRHLELVPNERIVQAWRVVDWDPGKYSIAKFELVEQGGGTKIVFDHTGFPKGQAEHLAIGWKAHYWEGLEKYLA